MAQLQHPSFFFHQLPHHSEPSSAKGPIIDVFGTVVQVFADHTGDDGSHQQFQLHITNLVDSQGLNGTVVGQVVFVASRFGDSDTQHQEPIPGIVVGAKIEVKGEYIDASHADAGPDNTDPVLPVVHFVHQPYGFVIVNGQKFQ